MRNIVRVAAVLALALCASGVVDAQNTVRGGTGKMRFALSRYGNVWISDASGVDQMDRASILVGLDSTHVFDYTNDAMYLISPLSITTGGIADTMATALIDNTYPSVPLPPSVKVRATVYAWRNDNFVIVKYSVINPSPSSYTVYIGMDVIPMPTEYLWRRNVAYDNTKKVAYYYRTGRLPTSGRNCSDSFRPRSMLSIGMSIRQPARLQMKQLNRHALENGLLPGFDAHAHGGRQRFCIQSQHGEVYDRCGGFDAIQHGIYVSYESRLVAATADSADARYNKTFTAVEQIAGLDVRRHLCCRRISQSVQPLDTDRVCSAEGSYARPRGVRALGRLVTTLVDQQLPLAFTPADLTRRGWLVACTSTRLTAGNYSSGAPDAVGQVECIVP